MAANGQKVGSIYVSLGVDLGRLDQEIGTARKRIDALLGKGKAREVTVSVKVNPSTASVEAAAEKLRNALGKGVTLTPKVSATGVQSFIAGFKRDVAANGGILVPVKGLKVDGRALNRQLVDAIGVVKVPVEADWRGGQGPQSAGPRGGGEGPSGAGSSGARRQTQQRQQRAQERTARAAEQEATQAEQNVRQGRPAAAPQSERQTQQRTTAARTRRAKAEERTATAAEQEATQATRRARTAAAPPPPAAAGATGGHSATGGPGSGDYVCPDCGKRFQSQNSLTGHIRVMRGKTRAAGVRAAGGTQEDVRRHADEARQAEDLARGAPAGSRGASAAGVASIPRPPRDPNLHIVNPSAGQTTGVRGLRLRPIGKIPEAHRAQAELARGPNGILAQLAREREEYRIGRNETPRAQALSSAFAQIKDEGSFELMSQLDPHMAEALHAYMSGDWDRAKMLTNSFEGEGVEGSYYTFGGAPDKAQKRKRSMARAGRGRTDPYAIDPVMLVRASLGQAISSDITAQRRPTSRNKTAAMKGQAGVRDRADVAVQQGAAESQAALHRQAKAAAKLDDFLPPTIDELLELEDYAGVPMGPDPERERERQARTRTAPKVLKPSSLEPSAFAFERSASPTGVIKGQADPEALARAREAEARAAARSTQQPLDIANMAFGPLQGAARGFHARGLGSRAEQQPGAFFRMEDKPPVYGMRRPARAEGGPVDGPDVPSASGFLSRPFGYKPETAAGYTGNVARENSYAWQKLRSAQIRKQPWCSHCGIGRLEAKQSRNSLTADHIVSQAHGGDPWDMDNLQTLCGSCNSRKGYQSGFHGSWDKPRPKGLLDIPGITVKDLLPNGRLFNVLGLRDAAKRLREGRASGGDVYADARARRQAAAMGARSQDRHGEADRQTGTYEARGWGSWTGTQQAAGPVAESRRIAALRAMANQTASPQEAEIARAALARLEGRTRADGGEVSREYLVGERGHELYKAKSGWSALIGQRGPQVMSFPEDGEIIPHHKLPPGMAQGGKINFTGYGNRPWIQKQIMAGQEAEQAGLASRTQAVRVQVTNWPQGLTNLPTAIAQAAGPARGAPAGRVAASPAAGTVQAAGPAPAVPAAASQLAKLPKAGAVSPLGKVESQEKAFASVDELRDRLTKVGTGIGESLQLAPVRALSVAFGQIAQTVVGGRKGILERAGVARTSAAEAQKATSRLEQLQSARANLEEQLLSTQNEPVGPGTRFADIGQRDAVVQQLQATSAEQDQAIKRQAQIAEERTKKAEEDQGRILTKPQIVRTQAAGLVGIVGGTLAFTAAMHAAQLTMGLFDKATSASVDAMSGFAQTTNQVTTDLAAAVKGSGGLADVGINRQFASIGLTAGLPANRLRDVAARQAGAENIGAQFDVLRAERNLAGRGGLGPGGLNGFGNGALAGIPVIGDALKWIGQTAGAAERFSDNLVTPVTAETLNNIQGGQNGMFGNAASAAGPLRPTTGSGSLLTDEVNALQNIFDDPLAAFRRGANIISNTASGAKGNLRTGLTPEAAQGQDAIKIINADAKRYSELAAQLKPVKDIAKNLAPLKDINPKLWSQLSAIGVGLDLKNGKLPTEQDWQAFFQISEKGANLPDQTSLLATMQPQLQAQIASMSRMAEFTRSTLLPSQFAMGQLGNPLASSAAVGISPMGAASTGALGGAFQGADPATIASLEQYSGALDDVRGRLQDIGTEGQAQLEKLGVPQHVIDEIKGLGEANRTLMERSQGEQLGLEQAQYNRQLMLSNRALGDAVGMTGKQGVNVRALVGYAKDGVAQYQTQVIAATRLGELQRDQVELSRESNKLSLAMSQRQLNFAIALSRINTPGSTPIERATRAREQELLNRDQQRQQNIAVRQQRGSIQIEEIQFSRAAKDALADVQQLKAGRAIQLDVRGTQALVEANNQLIAYDQSIAATYTDLGANYKSLLNQTQTDLEAATGKASKTFNAEVDANIGSLVAKYEGAFGTLLGSGDGTGVQTRQQAQATAAQHSGEHAMGTIFDTRGATSMVVGEAQGERVAVLRNPRRVGMMGGGGGQTTVNVNIGGSWSVRGDADVASIADQVARQVEDRLNRRAAIFASATT